MSLAKELLEGSRADAFLISEEMTAAQLRRLDLRLVQGFKRSGSTLEVKFADLAKLCEIADREDAALREDAMASAGVDRLRELIGEAAKDDEEHDE